MAWEGTFEIPPRDPALSDSIKRTHPPREPVHIEAAALHGRIVYFAVTGPWDRPQVPIERDTILSIGKSNLIIQTSVTILLLIAGSYLAFRNHRSGRGDRVGALRMAIAFLVLGLLAWALRTHHVPDLIFEFTLFTNAMGQLLYLVALVWIFYLALEPYVRRVWPETIISWSRFISGKWADPLVGRDVLIGGLVGVVSLLLTQVELLAPRWPGLFQGNAPMPYFSSADAMLHSCSNYAALFSGGISSMYYALILLFFLVLVRLITRRRWSACVIFVVVLVAATARWNVAHWVPESALSWAIQTVTALLFLMVLTRFGLVAIIACFLCRMLLSDFPIAPDFNLWYGNSSIVAIVSVLALLGVSFYTSLGGKPLFSLRVLDA